MSNTERLDELIEQMRRLDGRKDVTLSHSDADDLLCMAVEELGGEKGTELVKVWDKLPKWYG